MLDDIFLSFILDGSTVIVKLVYKCSLCSKIETYLRERRVYSFTNFLSRDRVKSEIKNIIVNETSNS